MVGWHHRLDGHEFEQAPGDSEGQGSLVCCSPWGHRESDTTERLSGNSNTHNAAELLQSSQGHRHGHAGSPKAFARRTELELNDRRGSGHTGGSKLFQKPTPHAVGRIKTAISDSVERDMQLKLKEQMIMLLKLFQTLLQKEMIAKSH